MSPDKKTDAHKLDHATLEYMCLGAIFPRPNTCYSHRTLNPGAMMEEQVDRIRTSIQGQGRGAVAAA